MEQVNDVKCCNNEAITLVQIWTNLIIKICVNKWEGEISVDIRVL